MATALDALPTDRDTAFWDAFGQTLGHERADSLDPLEALFIEQALLDYDSSAMTSLEPQALAALLGEFWLFGKTYNVGPLPLMRFRSWRGAREPQTYHVVEIIQEDAPFLVDSIIGELADAGVSVRAMFHPVVPCHRDDNGERQPGLTRHESMILMVVEHMSQAVQDRLEQGLRDTLADVRAAVEDHGAMVALLGETIASLEEQGPPIRTEDVGESLSFLRWARDDRFVFLGARTYQYPRTSDGSLAPEEPLFQPHSGLGVLRDPEVRVLRRAHEPAVLTRELQQQLDLSDPITVAKANLRSRVHRRVKMDYIAVRRYAPDGTALGETRFVGLFTADAYDRPVAQVPLIRRKVATVLAAVLARPSRHTERRLRNILENFPRDELFQINTEELLHLATEIAKLHDRPRIKLFWRCDAFRRFVSAFVFVPKDRYAADVGDRIGAVIAQAWNGHVSASYTHLVNTPLVRLHLIIGLPPTSEDADLLATEQAVVDACRTWDDQLLLAAERSGIASEDLRAFAHSWLPSFPASYRDRYDVDEALRDIDELRRNRSLGIHAFRHAADAERQFRFKLYQRGTAAALADVLPVLSDMGLRALDEFSCAISLPDAEPVHILEYLVEDPREPALDFSFRRGRFEDTFRAVWEGRTESDGFNQLVLDLSVGWRSASLLRALARYRQQTGLDPTPETQLEALRTYPEITRLLLALFAAKFDPTHAVDLAQRRVEAVAIGEQITAALKAVQKADHDRVLRRLALLIAAVVRTNFYQRDDRNEFKDHISFKIASSTLEDLPAPKPYKEIFVWAPHVEGVHLRFGAVARGGLRWSDRRDDYRTEILGLVKAQQVKNSVIVPAGAKGGFYPKQLPAGGSPGEIRAEAIRAYETFLSGMLDITDNRGADGSIVPPLSVVSHDDPDPYLVVAADKGTATFSDVANAISEAHGFWLGDAFASGGRYGYDHKAMGITAKGAWISVQRHFREMGIDVQKDTVRAIGVGDMSGDVFGNGMLLSRTIKLVAAFDHRHIFLDPNPDPTVSYAERERLFALPRSSWADYDAKLISKGGGVFPRDQKSIPLTPQVKAMLGVDADELSPPELMQAILRSPADLCWFGGIGTYVKARSESHADVGDRANDAQRVDAEDLQVKVIGEGANLGTTQAARIAFAKRGGRINTDFIDNSAGVDCSDNEVNIKIALNPEVGAGRLGLEARNELIKSMTDEVASRVLAHNYAQTLALSLQEATAAADLAAADELMRRLERSGNFDRKLEGLPESAGIAQLAAEQRGLTRPELAVLMAHAKLDLTAAITASGVTEDPAFQDVLAGYFPAAMSGFAEAVAGHRLQREIIATVLANDMINTLGATFPSRLQRSAECGTAELVTAFAAGRKLLGFQALWDSISALDGQLAAPVQLSLYQSAAAALRRQTYKIAQRITGTAATVGSLVERYRDTFSLLLADGPELLPSAQEQCEAHAAQLRQQGVPTALADAVAALACLGDALDVAALAGEFGLDPRAVARLYGRIGESVGLSKLRAMSTKVAVANPADRLAIRRLRDELSDELMAYIRQQLRLATSDGEPMPLPSTELHNPILPVDAPWTFSTLFIAASTFKRGLQKGAC